MVNEIAKILHEQYPECKIYIENVEQGFKEPCFFISQTSSAGSREVDTRFKTTNHYMVQFFPKPYKQGAAHTENQQCISMLKELTVLLQDVSIYHAKDMSGTLVDGVLNFACTYDDIFIVKKSESNMENYKHTFKEKKV